MFGDFSNFNANPVAAAEKPYGHTALTYPTYLQPPQYWGQSLLEKACDFYYRLQVLPIKNLRVPIVIKASKSVGAKSSVPKIFRFLHPA